MIKSQEFERIVIKGVMSSKDFLKKLHRRNITHEIFTIPVYQFIYQASMKHFKTNFDVLTFSDLKWLVKIRPGTDEEKQIKTSVVEKAESELSNVPDEPSRYQFCFNELIKLYQYRKYVEISEANLNHVKNKSCDPAELYQRVQTEMNKVRQETGEIEVRKTDIFSEEAVNARLEQYNHDKTSETSSRIPYPFPTMNFYTGGMSNTDLVVFVARHKVGKSIMLLNVAENLRKQGHSGIYVTIEQSGEEISMRADSLSTQLSHREIRLRKLQEAEETLYSDKLKEISLTDSKFIVIDMPRGCTVPFIESEIRSILDEGIDVKYIIIDYLGLMASDTGERDPIKTMGTITLSLRQLTRELKIPIISAQQSNRDSEKEKKKTSTSVAYSDQQGAHVTAMYALVPGDEPDQITLQTVVARDHEAFDLELLTHFQTMLIVENADQSDNEEKKSDMTMEESPF